ncbi:chorismate mutase aro7 [Komagataella kurtzmanii]|nr:chorismate mutase aro7 [Komagataella kurtzmanii]
MEFKKPATVLNLANIRQALVRMEDTVVFSFIERSQFYESPSVYAPNKYKIPNFSGSFLDWLLLQNEKTHSLVRRYESPDETPFFPDQLEESFLPSLNYPPILADYADEVNVNDEIRTVYIEKIVPQIAAKKGDQDENIGSTACADVDCLQALSRRVHFGKFVAEAKFQNEMARYTNLIRNKDIKGIEEAITDSAVEAKILERLIAKGHAYGTDPTLRYSQNPQSKVQPEAIAKIYKEVVIPLTKKVEVEYLLRRLGNDDEAEAQDPQRKTQLINRLLSNSLW